MTSKHIGAYIHIPFCVRKCFYCDFLSFATGGYAEYKAALLNEIAHTELSAYEIDTVFIGGGTPSILPPEFIAEILRALKNADAPEITLEANPGVMPASLAEYRVMGINRLSFGLQSTHGAELRRLGRIHSYDDFLKSYHTARDAGFANISVDLMHSLPGQGLEDWEATLERVIALAPEHVSVYGLMIEENTVFGQQLADGLLTAPDERLDREMYALACDKLDRAGYNRYEISNFAKSGYESGHNIKYWARAEYIGFGLGAHSFMNETRWRNTEDMGEYLAKNGLAGKHEEAAISRAEAMAEYLFLGLRMADGVSEDGFYKSFGCELRSVYGEQIKKHTATGLLLEDAGRVYLSPRGVDVSNVVMAEFL